MSFQHEQFFFCENETCDAKNGFYYESHHNIFQNICNQFFLISCNYCLLSHFDVSQPSCFSAFSILFFSRKYITLRKLQCGLANGGRIFYKKECTVYNAASVHYLSIHGALSQLSPASCTPAIHLHSSLCQTVQFASVVMLG